MINIVAPLSSTENNIYSFSEISYLYGYLVKNGIDANVKLLSVKDILVESIEYLSFDTIFVVQFFGDETYAWIKMCNNVFRGRKGLFGLTVQTYYDLFEKECKFDCLFHTNSYESVLRWIVNDTYECLPHCKNDLAYPGYALEQIARLPYIPVVSSRGCRFSCAFCAIACANKYSHEYIQREARDVFDEIYRYYTQYGKNRFYFVDSCFVGKDKESQMRALELSRLIQEHELRIKFHIETRADCIDEALFSELKRAGLSKVLIGGENLSNKVLCRYNKKISKSDVLWAVRTLEKMEISADLTLILFDPFTTTNELLENIDVIIDHRLFRFFEIPSVMRRMILIPNNRLIGERNVLYRKDKDGQINDYEKAYMYLFQDKIIQNLYDGLEERLTIWQEKQKKCMSEINDIRERKKVRNHLKREFFIELRSYLMNESDCRNEKLRR